MSTIVKICPEQFTIKNEFVIFLAGPIQGAPLWQTDAINYFLNNQVDDDIIVASPRRNDDAKKQSNFDFDYKGQVDWESEHLIHAAKKGVILFWLAKEINHDCSRAYAQTSRFELAEWAIKKSFSDEINLIVGIEPGFSGERYIRYRLHNHGIHFCTNLEETCAKTLSLIKQPMKASVNYQDMWHMLKSWLETDCTNGMSHKSKRALLLMDELEQKDKQ